MPRPLRVLIVEDNPTDARLIVELLRAADFDPDWKRVDSEAEFIGRLAGGFDIVLADYSLPNFNGLRALELLRQRSGDTPFILVSGTIGEDMAVAAIKLGASDYLMKDRLGRLGTAVLQAIEESRLRRERRETGEALQVMNRSLRAEIEERSLGAEALRTSEARFRELAETIQEVFWVADPISNAALYVSPAFAKIWGRPWAEVPALSFRWPEAVHPADRERVGHAAQASREGKSYQEEYRIIRPDGSERWIRDRAFPVLAEEGGVRRVVGVAEDITDSKRLHEQFLRAQRMEAIGTLAGGIAHDLNNILLPLLMVPTLLRPALQNDRDRSLLALIEQGAQRGAQVVRQILAFSRGTGGERISVQIRHLLTEMTNIMRETFPRDIALEETAGPELWPVSGNPTQLHQVLMNLCVNARDAMPRGGRLSLSAGNVDLTDADVLAHAPAKAGRHVVVKVVDTGHGMPPEILQRIFDPFFTTKAPAQGTGIGLSTVLGIVRDHGGFLAVASEPGSGSTFSIFFPVAAQAEVAATTPTSAPAPAGRDELVLVVDDEDSIRSAVQMTLEQNGYRILAARDGAEALGLLSRHRDSVRLVITDIVMPVMGGTDLIRSIRGIRTRTRVMATTGFFDPVKEVELQAAGFDAILPKPFTPLDLLEAVRAQIALSS